MSIKYIKKQITSLIDEGEDAFLMISGGEYFIQLKISENKSKIVAVAVSNAHLLKKDQLTEDQISAITRLGLVEDKEIGDFRSEFNVSPESMDKIALMVLDIFKIYKVNPSKLEFELD